MKSHGLGIVGLEEQFFIDEYYQVVDWVTAVYRIKWILVRSETGELQEP